MKIDYKFWEHNLNPVTMKRDCIKNNFSMVGAGSEQLADERWARAIEKAKNNTRIKKVSKFW